MGIAENSADEEGNRQPSEVDLRLPSAVWADELLLKRRLGCDGFCRELGRRKKQSSAEVSPRLPRRDGSHQPGFDSNFSKKAKSATPAATDTFSECFIPNWGISMAASS